MRKFTVAGHEGSDSPEELLWQSHPGEEPSNMTMLLHRYLFTVDETGNCKAMDLVVKLVKEALDDNFRALQEILSRLDGGPKTGVPESSGVSEPIVLSANTARKILKACHEEFVARPGD